MRHKRQMNEEACGRVWYTVTDRLMRRVSPSMRDRFQQGKPRLRPLRWIFLALLWMAGLQACQPALSATPPAQLIRLSATQTSPPADPSSAPPDPTQTVSP